MMDKISVEELLTVIGAYEIQQRRLLAQNAELERKLSEFSELSEKEVVKDEEQPLDGGEKAPINE